ncbi:RNA polymerase sigma-70 factor [Chitinophaga sp.]|uniref:RNA polymerase sigma factor n=1 Tax=Chitinophaga sp. TaxID=1869181 RepID=UPI002F91CD35
MIPLSTKFACEPALLEKIAAGDEMAFQQLFDHYADRIYGVAISYTKCPLLSEEIVQEVFLKIWIKRNTLPAVNNIADYIFIIARNRILNVLRRNKMEKAYLKQLATDSDENILTPEHQYYYKESKRLIENAVLALPPRQRLIYQLNQVQGLGLSEVADHLGLSRNTARNHLSRAMESIRAYVLQHADEILLLFALLMIPPCF